MCCNCVACGQRPPPLVGRFHVFILRLGVCIIINLSGFLFPGVELARFPRFPHLSCIDGPILLGDHSSLENLILLNHN